MKKYSLAHREKEVIRALQAVGLYVLAFFPALFSVHVALAFIIIPFLYFIPTLIERHEINHADEHL